ncbi:mandelate racemase/muconate lactonizing enzyme family protein [Paracandidimonas soli]|uniref:L-alanine-DL-glutamate epimerase-like enolase superfamily enzyme n=1 Tax=Paracandidimonas soli TaxID=1917182 RepID=A0A4R3UY90_9BURK|nr:mandelate racemase/muconate lactonizing enzyme family protein [Paracandidimonas soli]TCU97286.1 L-alanine-DL-glutamate epimerase-like enolase superfamily enzyme [Paracandidimonas soli]
MKIADIRCSLHRHEIDLPGIGKSIESRMFVFVEVETDDGLSGFGITGSMLPWAVMACIEHHLKPALVGMDVLHTDAIHAKVWKQLNSRTYTGVISNALSAVDIALWDIRGKKENRSVHELLGGYRDWAPTYATFGYPFFDEDQLAEYARKFIADGHRMLKMVVGGEPTRTWRDDVRRVRAAREAAGPDVALMIDANCYFDPNEARLLCREIEDCNVHWFEEPLHQNDARALADLRAHTSIPIAAGQMEGHRWRYRELVVNHSVDVLQPNVLYNGGFTESLKVAHMAQAFNLPLANGGGWPIFNMHLLCGVLNGGPVEFHYGMWQTGRHFFDGTPDPVDGRMQLSGRPGLGFTPNRDHLRDARITDPQKSRFDGRDGHGYLLRDAIGRP